MKFSQSFNIVFQQYHVRKFEFSFYLKGLAFFFRGTCSAFYLSALHCKLTNTDANTDAKNLNPGFFFAIKSFIGVSTYNTRKKQ